MTKRTLTILLVVCGALAALLFFTPTGFDRGAGQESVAILNGVAADRISKVVLEKGGETVELLLQDGRWVLPARANYPANPTKVRSLLLKLLDLSSTQTLPSSEEALKSLGLDEEAVKSDYPRVKFFDAGGIELGGLQLGKPRTAQRAPQGPMGMPSSSGQYVRRLSDGAIFLVSQPVTISTELVSWLDTGLVNVLSSAVHQVSQQTLGGEAQETLFALSRTTSEPTGPQFALNGSIPEGEELHESVVSQVTSGLENLSIIDVHTAESEEVSKAVFDRETVYALKNGLVYKVQTASKEGDRVLAKLSVSFDPELAKEAAQAKADEAKEATPAPTAAPEGDDQKKDPEKKDPEKKDDTEQDEAKEAEDAKPEVSSEEEARTRNAVHEPWVYEFAGYQGSKFRKAREDLLKKKEAPKQEPPPELNSPEV